MGPKTRMSTPRPEGFPRSPDLPRQSPLFWVEQKDRYLRQLLIRDLEAITGRRFIVYFANASAGADAQIDSRDSTYMAELLGDIGGAPVDLLVETMGGQTDGTEALISLIQNEVSDLRVVVANAAKSNGTLLGLAAQCILMGSTSELGPIEPQINTIPVSILMLPEIARDNFILHKYGEYAFQQTRTLAKTLLANGMMKGKDDADIEKTVQMLASRDKFFSHGSTINHVEAQSMGLNVQYLPPDDDLWRRIWLLYCMYEYDCRKSRYIKVFEGALRSTAVAWPAPASSTAQTP